MMNQSNNQNQKNWRWPAEWETHRALWTSFPNRLETWGSALEKAQEEFAQLLLAVSAVQSVEVCISSEQHRATAQRVIKKFHSSFPDSNLDQIKFHQFPTKEAWIRDFGPIWLTNPNGEKLALDHRFNTWGGKYPPFDQENDIPTLICNLRNHQREAHDFILEGGSVDTNGDGVVLTSEACLLNQNRNSHLSKTEIEDHLKQVFRLKQVIWLGDGIAGDDTDGHIDDMTRFIAEDVILTAVERNPKDVNYKALQENWERLQDVRLPGNRKPEIIPIAMPQPVVYEGERLPASHLNFVFGNGCVFAPHFPAQNTPGAKEAFEEAIKNYRPNTKVVWLDSTQIVVGRGSLHCLSMQEPA